MCVCVVSSVGMTCYHPGGGFSLAKPCVNPSQPKEMGKTPFLFPISIKNRVLCLPISLHDSMPNFQQELVFSPNLTQFLHYFPFSSFSLGNKGFLKLVCVILARVFKGFKLHFHIFNYVCDCNLLHANFISQTCFFPISPYFFVASFTLHTFLGQYFQEVCVDLLNHYLIP